MGFLRQWESVPGSFFCCFTLVLLVFAAGEVQFCGLLPAAAQLEMLLTKTFCGEPCRKTKSQFISCHSTHVQSAAGGTNNLHFHPGHWVWERLVSGLLWSLCQCGFWPQLRAVSGTELILVSMNLWTTVFMLKRNRWGIFCNRMSGCWWNCGCVSSAFPDTSWSSAQTK